MPQQDPDPEFTKKVLKQIRQIEVNTKRVVTDGMAGSYHSIFEDKGWILRKFENTKRR